MKVKEEDEVTNQNSEVRAGGVGKWASSAPMLSKKSPVRLLPLIAGMLEGAIQPINPNPITLKSVLSQSLWKLLKPPKQKYQIKQFTNVTIMIQFEKKKKIKTQNQAYQSCKKNIYHVNLPPFPIATTCLKGFLALAGDLTNPANILQNMSQDAPYLIMKSHVYI